MIKSFSDKETEKIFHQQRSRKLPGDIQLMALKKLWMLAAATAPALRFHQGICPFRRFALVGWNIESLAMIRIT
ncbi:MAG: hypothetical protein II943_04640 [Victivallales bacterium]|nr:hypothetical protein [Victivallales bacterium]